MRRLGPVLLALALGAGCAHGASGRDRRPVQGCDKAPAGWRDLAAVVRYELWLWYGQAGLTEADRLAEVELTLLAWHEGVAGGPLGYFWARTQSEEGAERWHLVSALGAPPERNVHPRGPAPRPAAAWVQARPPTRAEAERRYTALRARYGLEADLGCAQAWLRRFPPPNAN